MQRTSRKVTHFFRRAKHGSGVLNFKRITELYTKVQAGLTGKRSQRAQHRYRVLVFQVMFKCSIRNDDITITKVIMQNCTHAFWTQQGRITFNIGVKTLLFHQVDTDFLDFTGRATVHRG